MGRSVLSWVCVLAMVALPVGGCSEETAAAGGAGGSGDTGGDGGAGGMGGVGGADICVGVACEDDRNECTAGDGLCDPADGECKYSPVADDTECDARNECTVGQCASGVCEAAPLADGTACSGDEGTCQDGNCVADCEGSVCPCSEAGVRGAIAEGGGPFTFDCDGPTTVVTVEEIVIDNDVALDGEGSLTVNGNDDHHVFELPFGVTVELDGIAVTGGGAGGIHMDVATLTLTNSTVSGNTGGGISSRAGRKTLTNSTVSGNTGRGIVSRVTTLTVTSSTVSGNSDGGIFNLPAGSGRRCTLTNSTVSGNTATDGGGIFGSCTLTNSTVSGNTATNGGGIFTHASDGAPSSPGSVTLTNSTVSGNMATDSGDDIWNGGALTLTNSLVGGECSLDDTWGSVTSNGHNIESPGDTCGFDQSTDQVDVSADDLKHGPLQDNGGPTQTHALLPGSVAIDVIPAEDCVDADDALLTTDQRGEPRPGGTMCDVGSFEVQEGSL